MNTRRDLTLGASLLLTMLAGLSNTVAAEQGIEFQLSQSGAPLAVYRQSVVTQTDFDAFLESIPSEERAPFLRSPERVENTLTSMMLGRRALQFAQASGALNDQPLQGRILLEAGRLAVGELRESFLAEHMLDDYSEVARELFLSRREDFLSEPSVDFAHVIVAARIDGDPTAGMRMILDLYDQATEADDLRAIALEIGQAEDAHRAGGDHTAIALNQLETILANELRQLRPGEISEPIRTSSGWHLVQLTSRNQPQARSFDEVREEVIGVARARHREDLIVRFRNELLEGGLEIPEGAVQQLLSRHGVSWSRTDG